ncbi:hypothetical protein DPEC_G00335110 [Dallia pectoralis]|uniref:Uncharacterized protein n=1 Tax=Dallia pectoralis TaxID=75939 RepID=A0ACC2F6X4_DALPE|nr:hypothetical protein DPEC_G00335110 [Dallia pectoralis]
MDLAYKQGDSIEIIRVIENPEGRWLGRTQEGSYGYVKTEGVETDFDTLKRQGASLSQAQDVYDDVDFTDKHNCDNRGPGVVLPPPPDEDEELYDDLDSSFNSGVSSGSPDPRTTPKPRGLSWVFRGLEDWRKCPVSNIELPPPSQLDQEDNAGGEEIYDDVDVAQPVSSKTKGKVEDKDPKKQKKFEKEEKEFRKKFKHEGEIQVLYQVTIGSTVTNKKWSGKDLPIKAGETLDVIVTPKDGKVICRNEEGKFGYVLTSYIVVEDADIYDDIGDDCIYDND